MRVSKGWLWLWLVPALTLLLSIVVSARFELATVLMEQFLLALGISSLTLRPEPLRLLLIAFLGISLVAAAAETLLSASLWQGSEPNLIDTLYALDQNTVSTVATRAWRLPEGSGDLSLSFEARLVEGEVGWDWFRSQGNFSVTPLVEDGEVFTRVTTPKGIKPLPHAHLRSGACGGGDNFSRRPRDARPLSHSSGGVQGRVVADVGTGRWSSV